MLSSILRICGALFDAFAQDFINTFCMGISRDLHEVSAPFPQKIIRRQLAPLEVYFHSSGVNMPEYRKPTVDEAPK